MPFAARSSTCSPQARRTRCGSISSATRSRRFGRFDPVGPAVDRPGQGFHADARFGSPARRRDSSSASAPRYREAFGGTATGDPLYEAVSGGRRMSGMEHWLPLFEERLTTLFDHLGENDLVLRDAGVDQAVAARRNPSTIIMPIARKTMSRPGAATVRLSRPRST